MAIGNLILGQSSGSISASTLIKTGQGGCLYIYPTASSAGIIRIWDGVAAAGGTNLTGSIALTANTRVDVLLGFGTGCFVELVSGTATFYVNYV